MEASYLRLVARNDTVFKMAKECPVFRRTATRQFMVSDRDGYSLSSK